MIKFIIIVIFIAIIYLIVSRKALPAFKNHHFFRAILWGFLSILVLSFGMGMASGAGGSGSSSSSKTSASSSHKESRKESSESSSSSSESDTNSSTSSDSSSDSAIESNSNNDDTQTSGVDNSNNKGDMKTDQQGTIVGNSKTMIYHTPGQHGYRMNSANAVYFNSEAEAQAAGYRPALK